MKIFGFWSCYRWPGEVTNSIAWHQVIAWMFLRSFWTTWNAMASVRTATWGLGLFPWLGRRFLVGRWCHFCLIPWDISDISNIYPDTPGWKCWKSGLFVQRWLRHLFNSEKNISQYIPETANVPEDGATHFAHVQNCAIYPIFNLKSVFRKMIFRSSKLSWKRARPVEVKFWREKTVFMHTRWRNPKFSCAMRFETGKSLPFATPTKTIKKPNMLRIDGLTHPNPPTGASHCPFKTSPRGDLQEIHQAPSIRAVCGSWQGHGFSTRCIYVI